MKSAILYSIGSLGLLLVSAVSFAEDTCTLTTPVPPDAFMTKVVGQIQESCGALEIEDRENKKKEQRALKKCCKDANDFLSKNVPPCSEKAQLRYKVKLAFALCDHISSAY